MLGGTDLLHILEDEVQLPSSAEGLFQLDDVLLLEGAEHLELPQRRFFDLLIFCATEGAGYDGSEAAKTKIKLLTTDKKRVMARTPRFLTFAVLEFLDGHNFIGLLQ